MITETHMAGLDVLGERFKRCYPDAVAIMFLVWNCKCFSVQPYTSDLEALGGMRLWGHRSCQLDHMRDKDHRPMIGIFWLRPVDENTKMSFMQEASRFTRGRMNFINEPTVH